MLAILATCMNRNGPLAVSLPSWRAFKAIIVIVDWCSAEPVRAPGAYVARVEGKPHFDISKAKNLAARIAKMLTATRLLILDADISTPRVFPTGISPDTFFHGAAGGAHGSVLLDLAAFEDVGGYDERRGQGRSEDNNLYMRLKERGYREKIFEPGLLVHADHEGRWDNYPAPGTRRVNPTLGTSWSPRFEQEKTDYVLEAA